MLPHDHEVLGYRRLHVLLKREGPGLEAPIAATATKTTDGATAFAVVAALFFIAPTIAVSIAPPAPPATMCEIMPPMLKSPDCAAAVTAGIAKIPTVPEVKNQAMTCLHLRRRCPAIRLIKICSFLISSMQIATNVFNQAITAHANLPPGDSTPLNKNRCGNRPGVGPERPVSAQCWYRRNSPATCIALGAAVCALQVVRPWHRPSASAGYCSTSSVSAPDRRNLLQRTARPSSSGDSRRFATTRRLSR